VLILRDGMRLVCIGMAIGLALGLAGGRLFGSFLFGITPTDGPTFLLTTTVLGAVSLAACAIPARRAMRVPPIQALRQQ